MIIALGSNVQCLTDCQLWLVFTHVRVVICIVTRETDPRYISEVMVLHKPKRALQSANQSNYFLQNCIHSPRHLVIELLQSLHHCCG